MKFLPLALSVAVVALSGCGDKASAPTAAATPAPAAAAPAAAPKAAPAAPRVIEVSANDTMKFSLAAIEAKAGETLKISFTNAGTLPKEAMGHNFVVLKPGTDAAAFAAAAAAAKATDYIPESMKDAVLGHTAILGPKKTEELVLADLKPGEYVFLCSFPAHFAIGMKGTITVK